MPLNRNGERIEETPIFWKLPVDKFLNLPIINKHVLEIRIKQPNICESSHEVRDCIVFQRSGFDFGTAIKLADTLDQNCSVDSGSDLDVGLHGKEYTE